MAALRITVLIEEDGREPVRLVRRFEPTDKIDFERTYADSASFVALPVALATIQALLIQGEAALGVKIRGDGTALVLNPGGFVLVVDAATLAGTTIQQDSGSDAKITGFTAGE